MDTFSCTVMAVLMNLVNCAGVDWRFQNNNYRALHFILSIIMRNKKHTMYPPNVCFFVSSPLYMCSFVATLIDCAWCFAVDCCDKKSTGKHNAQSDKVATTEHMHRWIDTKTRSVSTLYISYWVWYNYYDSFLAYWWIRIVLRQMKPVALKPFIAFF